MFLSLPVSPAFMTVIAAFRWGFSEESFLKGSHTVRPVWCVSTCVHFCAFYLFTCGGCDVEPTIRKRPACLKSLLVLSFVFFFLPPLFLSSSPFPPSSVYKAFAHKLQRITRHTPFRCTEPDSSSVTSQCACVCVKGNIWAKAFVISHFLPALPPQSKESARGKTKREESGVGLGGGGADWVIAAH